MYTASPENNLGSKNGGSNSGSSSGKSGSSEENEAEVVDALESEQDLYHDINRELEDIQDKRE